MFSYHLKIIKYCQQRLENYSGAKLTYFCLVSLIVLCTEISFSINPIAVKNVSPSAMLGIKYQSESSIAKGLVFLFNQKILEVDDLSKTNSFVIPIQQIKPVADIKAYLNTIQKEVKGALAQLFADICTIMPAGPPVRINGIINFFREKLNHPLSLAFTGICSIIATVLFAGLSLPANTVFSLYRCFTAISFSGRIIFISPPALFSYENRAFFLRGGDVKRIKEPGGKCLNWIELIVNKIGGIK